MSERARSRTSGLYDFGYRSYDPVVGQWLSPDPAFDGLNLHAYVHNNPLKYVDPEGKDAIPVVFPDYQIRASGTRFSGLGHAGVILIDNNTGHTRYYEFGRYDAEGQGVVRRLRIPDVKIDAKTGKPTEQSLARVMEVVSQRAGKPTRVEGTYVKNDNYQEMIDYAQGRLEENGEEDREPYGICTNNCGHFVQDTLESGGEDTPAMVDPRPNSYIEELQEHYENEVQYDPKDKQLTQREQNSDGGTR